MMHWMSWLCTFFRALLARRLILAAENLALRQQLAIYRCSAPRPKLRCRDRLFWLLMARLWSAWASVLVVVSPATVLRWHRHGFRYYWRWKSHGKHGRKRIDAEARMLIRQMSRDNPTWGTPRIKAELHLLGHDLSKATIDKYHARPRKPPSPSWRFFLKNHVAGLASMDFFVVPTATFRLLYALVILRHDRRRIVHFNVTAHPTAGWVAQQLREAFPFDLAPRYLIHDRDGIYGNEVHRCLKSMNIEEVVIPPRSPWQNSYVERLIGTIRRELLAHVIVLNERHLRLLMPKFVRYYHTCRTHRALEQNSPEPREIESRERGKVIAEPHLGGLHHRYRRSA
jgi:transposase InsO family protein